MTPPRVASWSKEPNDRARARKKPCTGVDAPGGGGDGERESGSEPELPPLPASPRGEDEEGAPVAPVAPRRRRRDARLAPRRDESPPSVVSFGFGEADREETPEGAHSAGPAAEPMPMGDDADSAGNQIARTRAEPRAERAGAAFTPRARAATGANASSDREPRAGSRARPPRARRRRATPRVQRL